MRVEDELRRGRVGSCFRERVCVLVERARCVSRLPGWPCVLEVLETRCQAICQRLDDHYGILPRSDRLSALDFQAAFWGHIHIVPYLLKECKIDPNVQVRACLSLSGWLQTANHARASNDTRRWRGLAGHFRGHCAARRCQVRARGCREGARGRRDEPEHQEQGGVDPTRHGQGT